ncbi:uncharacterized protein TRIADDRAFT_58576 [Trichoplax adhaerens]|uniref:G-protein coupled receptors family 1 profile domain-containing protein n=1 Tax=Trichoplax adhaerens TaxID=10228 RepID=B3S331_TRIAD|nr:hypothetical protein TRIADDRAFT_58576 [Trichoplax adhaerens]EDV22894.1 hypothetical protein TRIADDRAFT_58576 [Trichoplax adhaerens]|eukprot:XP_002114760.1 hypothetical protein TRIADDRAFT_58576 [Trichoplax adhaerens]
MVSNNSSLYPEYGPTSLATIRVAAYSVIGVISILGNLLVLIAFYREKSLRIPTNYLIINLAITDILNGIFKDTFIILGTLTNLHIRYKAFCDFDGFMQILLYLLTIYSLLATAIFRYLVIIHSYGKKITVRVVKITVAIIWTYSLAISLSPVLGWNRYVYQRIESACLPDWLYPAGRSYVMYAFITDSIIPLSLLGICYLCIYIFIRRNAKRFMVNIKKIQPDSLNRSLLRKSIKKEIEITKKMFFVYLVFVICYFPYTIVVFILAPSGVAVPPVAFFIVGFLVNANSAVNPFVYAVIYKSIRKAYYEIIFRPYTYASTILLSIKFHNTGTLRNCNVDVKNTKYNRYHLAKMYAII